MKMSKVSLAAGALAAAAVLSTVGWSVTGGGGQPSHDDIAGKPDLVVRDATKELKRTLVTPTLEEAHQAGTNLVWCVSFQMAWDQFTKLFGEALRLEGEDPLAKSMSEHPSPANVLDEASYVARIGMGPKTIEEIEADLERKFNGTASPSILPKASELRNDDILAYAYLFKNLAFLYPMTKGRDPLVFQGAVGKAGAGAGSGGTASSRVRSFGVWEDTKDWKNVAGQIVVKRYESPKDFIVELRTKETGDRLIVARLAPGKTLKETVTGVLAAAAKGTEGSITKEERFEAPVLNFDVTRSFDEFAGKKVLNPGYTEYQIATALQNIRFKFDEKGAVLKSEAVLWAEAKAIEDEPRRFVCDGPFLIVMARADATEPYFAAWIENAELLAKE